MVLSIKKTAVIYIKAKITICLALSALFSEVRGKANGSPLCVDYTEDSEIDTAAPVKGIITHKNTEKKELPAINALYTIHKGDYDDLNLAFTFSSHTDDLTTC